MMATHRHCKQRVDRIMLQYATTVEDTRILVEEIEDVRNERDSLHREIAEAVHAWDELSGDEPMSREFIDAMERLRDQLPLPLLSAEKDST